MFFKSPGSLTQSTLGLAVRQGSDIVPTNAGILAACDDPTRFLPSAWMQCGRLRGPNGTDIFDQTEIYGPMPRAADRVMEFLLKHAYRTAVFGEVRRRDTYSIPVEAIREIVVMKTLTPSKSVGRKRFRQ
jgi:predicted HTH transcriptional regulator